MPATTRSTNPTSESTVLAGEDVRKSSILAMLSKKSFISITPGDDLHVLRARLSSACGELVVNPRTRRRASAIDEKRQALRAPCVASIVRGRLEPLADARAHRSILLVARGAELAVRPRVTQAGGNQAWISPIY